MSNHAKWNSRHIIQWWETYRLIYNGVLLTIVIGSAPALITNTGAYLGILCFGFIANACYSLGPLIELYLHAYGIRIGYWRYVVFTSGLLFSIFVVFLSAFLILPMND